MLDRSTFSQRYIPYYRCYYIPRKNAKVRNIIVEDAKKTCVAKESKRKRKAKNKKELVNEEELNILLLSSCVHQEVPRLRGHSKFSRLFRQRRESPLKLMLTGHAISSGHSRAARYFSPVLSPFDHSKETPREHIYYSCP